MSRHSFRRSPSTDDAEEIIDTLCAGCDLPASVNDIGLCRDCNAKLDRDLIRARDWEYSPTAALTPEAEREILRLDVIRKHGAVYELIEPPNKVEQQARKPKPPAPHPVQPHQAGTYTESDVLASIERILGSTDQYIWREWAEVTRNLRREYPDLDPKQFGHKSLRRMVQAHPKRFHTQWDDPKHKHTRQLYIRLAKDHTQKL